MTNPDKWSDPSWQQYAWGTDVMQDALNYVFTLQPFSLGNLHRRAVFTKPRPTFPFVQGPPRNHGANIELRYGPLISGVSFPADANEQTLPQPISWSHRHKRVGSKDNTDNRFSYSVMGGSSTPEKGTNIQNRQRSSHSLRMSVHQELLKSLFRWPRFQPDASKSPSVLAACASVIVSSQHAHSYIAQCMLLSCYLVILFGVYTEQAL